MQVSVENMGGLERRIKVQVPEEKISSEIQNRLVKLSKTTRVQGFRPGKVPLKVIQGRYGEQVRQEVIGQVVQSSFQEAILQENLQPAGMPNIDPLEQGDGLTYTATFEVYPEIILKAVDTLEVERPVCDISDADIEKMTDILRKQHSTQETVERAAKEGDALVVDFVGKIDGEVFEGGSAQDFEIEIGSKRLIEGFEEGLVNSKAGDELELELTFPEDYQATELAGKPVVFSVKVKEVKEVKPAELNEDFFKLFGIKVDDVEAFREEIRKNMEREVANAVKTQVRDNILDCLYEANSLDLPRVMVENEAQRLHEEFKQNLKQQGIPDEAIAKADPASFDEQAKKRVSLQLILAEIIKQEDMKADPKKVRQMIEHQAQSYEDPAAIINWYYGDNNRLREVEALALEDEVVEWVLKGAKVQEVKQTFDEVMNKGQTG